MSSQPPHEFVITSSVRTEIVLTVSATTPTETLLSEIDASDSAVYDALSTLRDRGLLTQSEGGWKRTAYGALVADSISAWQASETFRDWDSGFWKHHDITVIPARFRQRLPEIGEYEIVRDTPQDPNRSEDVAVGMLESADACKVTTPSLLPKRVERQPPEQHEAVTFCMI